MKRVGVFTKNVLSLELQLRTLFEDCGGTESLAFLDKLSKLSKKEQQAALNMFDRVLDKVAAREPVLGEEEAKLADFEQELYNSIVDEIDKKQRPGLKLVDGGTAKPTRRKLIDFEAAKESRQRRDDSQLH